MDKYFNRLYKAKKFEELAEIKPKKPRYKKKKKTSDETSPVLRIQIQETISCNSTIECIAITHQKSYIITGTDDNIVRLYIIDERSIPKVLYSHSTTICKLLISKDDSYLLSTDASSESVLYNLKSKRVSYRFLLPIDRILTINFTHTDQYLAFFTAGSRLSLYNLHTNRLQASIDKRVLTSISSYSSQYLVIGLFYGSIEVLNMPKLSLKYSHRFHDTNILNVYCMKNARMIIVGCQEFIISNIFDNTYRRIIYIDCIIHSVCHISSDFRYIVYMGDQNKIKVWNIEFMEEVDEIEDRIKRGLAISRDNRWIITYEDSNMTVWSFYDIDKEA
jgi:WD40 repeat protein